MIFQNFMVFKIFVLNLNENDDRQFKKTEYFFYSAKL